MKTINQTLCLDFYFGYKVFFLGSMIFKFRNLKFNVIYYYIFKHMFNNNSFFAKLVIQMYCKLNNFIIKIQLQFIHSL